MLIIGVAIISGIGIFVSQNEREEPTPVAEHNAEIKLPVKTHQLKKPYLKGGLSGGIRTTR